MTAHAYDPHRADALAALDRHARLVATIRRALPSPLSERDAAALCDALAAAEVTVLAAARRAE